MEETKPAAKAAKAIAALLAIKSIESNNQGELIIIAQPHALQPTGVFKVHPVQEQRLLRRLGLTNRAQLKHLVAMTNGTSKMAVTLVECKAGDVWEQTNKLGEVVKTGTYEKDWTRADINELELGFAAKQMIAAEAVKSIFADMSNYGAPVTRTAPQPEPIKDELGAGPNIG